jgi:hypothetical protein
MTVSIVIERTLKFSGFLRLVIEPMNFLPLLGSGSLLQPSKNELRQQDS